MKIIGIKVGNGVYVAKQKDKTNYYEPRNVLSIEYDNIYFDRKKPEKTAISPWFYIDSVPSKIERRQVKAKDMYFVIKDESYVSEKFPKRIDSSNSTSYPLSDNVLKALYNLVKDITEIFVPADDVEFEIIYEADEKVLSFGKIESSNDFFEDEIYVEDGDINHRVIDTLFYPEFILGSRPCMLSSEKMFEITKQYVINNIDERYAQITSDYSFEFVVEKVIPNIKPKMAFEGDLFDEEKKDKYVIVDRNSCGYNVLTIRRDESGNGEIIPPLCAENHAELRKKLDAWLKYVIEVVNEPVCVCPHCLGTGLKFGLDTVDVNKEI